MVEPDSIATDFAPQPNFLLLGAGYQQPKYESTTNWKFTYLESCWGGD